MTKGNPNNRAKDRDKSNNISDFTGIAYTDANKPAVTSISIQIINKATATIHTFSAYI